MGLRMSKAEEARGAPSKQEETRREKKATREKQLSRVGWALATWSKDESEVTGGSFGGLAGERQTGNSGVLTALIRCTEATRGSMRFATGSAYVFKGWRKLKAGKTLNGNRDLWNEANSL